MFIFLLKEIMYRNDTKIKINKCLDPAGIGIPNSCNLSEIIKKKKNKQRRNTLIYKMELVERCKYFDIIINL